jgi:hypothetical protein
MERSKVLSKKEVEQLLKEDGNILRYATIQGKVYVQDKNWNKLGAVRFDTFLKMKLKKVRSVSYTDNFYKLES